LLGEHQIEWAAPLLDAGARSWSFRRGFLDQVALSAADFGAHGSTVIRRTTARDLTLLDDEWQALLTDPAAPHLCGVYLRSDADGDDIAAALADDSRLGGLRSVSLVGVGLTDGGLARLAAAPHLGRLEQLNVGSNDLTTAGLRSLAGATFAESLRSLGVEKLAAAPDGFVELAASPRWRRLAILRLDSNQLSGGHLARLSAAARLPALTTLSLAGADVDDDPDALTGLLALPHLGRLILAADATTAAVRGLLDAPAARRYAGVAVDLSPPGYTLSAEPKAGWLEVRNDSYRIDLEGWIKDAGYLGPGATATLCGPGERLEPVAGPWPRLPDRAIVRIEFERPGASAWNLVRVTGPFARRMSAPAPPTLASAVAQVGTDGPSLLRRGCDVWEDWPERWRGFLRGPRARRLRLWSERTFGDADLRELLDVPAFARLRDIDLGGTGITLAGVRELVTAPQAANLRHLRLSFNELGDDMAEVIADSPLMSKLVSLKLSFCGIGDRGVAALAASAYLRRLTTLKLWGGRGVIRPTNQIGDAGAIAIAGSPTLARLMGLRLRGNDIGDAGAKALAASPYLQWMRDLNIAENPIGPEGMRALEERFGDRLGHCIGEAELLPD
jgi:hypothetical protein